MSDTEGNVNEARGRASPRVSVVIRSLGRLAALAELLDTVLSQDHDSFEVVVVEQTQHPDEEDLERLKRAFSDERVRVLERPPLGGPGARNEGVRNAAGKIVILIDDDDLPLGSDWIAAHEAHYDDPKLIGLTARHVRSPGEHPPYPARWPVKQRCMSYSLLATPYTFARLDVDVQPVMWIHGTNSSFRRKRIIEAGLWDETVSNQDEHSLAFKLNRIMKPGEYVAFKAHPPVLRRMDWPGGMAKRLVSVEGELRNQLQFAHRVIGRYHPRRFRLLYPVYMGWALGKTLNWIWRDLPEERRNLQTRIGMCLEAFRSLPSELRAERRHPGDQRR